MPFPFSPWENAPYSNAVERTPSGGLSLSGFLCEVRKAQAPWFSIAPSNIFLFPEFGICCNNFLLYAFAF